MLSTSDDDVLIDRLNTDEINAFREIYDRYWDKLYVVARNRINDREEAEEIVQDIFCNFWRRRKSLVLTKGLNNYFSIAVKYEVINRLARQARANTYLKQAAKELSEVDESTLMQLDLNELQNQLQSTINTLPEKCQLVFRLQHEQGYSQRRIAEELDISEKTVEAHLSKARKVLRNSFSNFFYLIFL
ncbi:RNA polymerase sigma-70 factor [Pedobacter sp. BS3]|uniref:RNA polymerase sigma-70 factor n=1 Tax=Pedobacter sp. BS3 TaxID=2567937 RepID=UPI0011ED9077|nr:RNA polymerase sigma-70 factor [Pedobacter sp. BS3]TZF82226.1 RNA polymerase sigma-70 factor [Pedobacter sp. BS3]